MLVKDVLQKTTQFFRDKGFESARLDSELLISAALNWERMKLYLNYEQPLNDDEVARCRESVRRRASGEPVAYILGRKDFYNHSFVVSSAVLIPRPETEQIVEEAERWMKLKGATRIVDLGTGSGCIGLSVLAAVPDAKLCGVDISADAVAIAETNAAALGLTDQARFLVADADVVPSSFIREALGGAADIVVANPPYIAENDTAVEEYVKKFEPTGALFSAEQGLAHIRKWAAKTAEVLRPGGMVMFEIGHEQGLAARDIFAAAGRFTDITIVKDLSGRERFIRSFLKSETNEMENVNG